MKSTHTRRAAATPTFSPPQALATAAVMAARADGKVGPREIERLRLMMREQPLLAHEEHAELFLAERVAAVFEHDEAALLRACRAALPPRLRETAYAWAAQMAQEDGSLHQKEHAFLERLRAALDVPGPLAAKIRAVTAIRRAS
ncbi:MAG: TerB family tellurite resistance protein [Elusimicrobiota bacterium]|nr:MAG: TerB family tellurite resistance protein [Elusimicrobiota bacterium]